VISNFKDQINEFEIHIDNNHYHIFHDHLCKYINVIHHYFNFQMFDYLISIEIEKKVYLHLKKFNYLLDIQLLKHNSDLIGGNCLIFNKIIS